MKFKHLFSALAIITMAVASCENNLEPVNPEQKHEVYTVNLTCDGEIKVSQQPLTRFTPSENDLYGIQVSYRPVSGGSYRKYAYGLFDNVSNLTIDLLSDYEFKVEVDLIIDGKNQVYSDGIKIDSLNFVGYGYPFQAYNNYSGKISNTITKVSNEFIYSEDCYFIELGASFQEPGSSSYSNNPEGVEAYYGRIEFTPMADGETVSIFLKRMVYGITIIADDFLTEGVVDVDFNYMTDYTLTTENKIVEKTYAYRFRSSWYNYEELSDACDFQYVGFTWTKDDGTVLKLKEQYIEFNRLKQTIINITFYEDTTIDDVNLSINYEDQVFVEDGQPVYNFGETQDEYEW